MTLYVIDDDSERGIYSILIIINETTSKPTNGEINNNIYWAVGVVVLVLVIFIVLRMLVFITQSKKSRKQLSAEQSTALSMGTGATGPGGAAEQPTEFTTAGKLDFVILKRSVGKRYVKFELHRTTKSPAEFLGLIWKSAFFNNSWVPVDKVLDPKDKVIDYLQLKIQTYNNKGWAIDYGGNGTILSKQESSAVTLKDVVSKLDTKSVQPQTIEKDKDTAEQPMDDSELNK